MSRMSKELLKRIWQKQGAGREADHAPERFEPGQLYFGAEDRHLKSITRAFPAVIWTTHPVYVLERLANLGWKMCPCTTRPNRGVPQIVEGCVLHGTHRTINKTSYVLTNHAFNLKKGAQFQKKLDYAGTVPEKCFKEPK